MEFHQNGSVLLAHDPRATYSWAGLFMHAGSVYEPDDRPGLAHLLEHQLSDRLPDDAEAEVQKLLTIYSTTQLAANTTKNTKALMSLLDIQLQFTAIDVAKDILAIELDEYPVDSAYTKGLTGLLGAHSPFTRSSGGTIEGIQQCTEEDLRSFATDTMRPDRATLVIAGNFPLDEMQALTKELSQHPPISPTPATQIAEKIFCTTSTDETFATIQLFIPTVAPGQFTDRTTFMVLRRLLAGERYALLNRTLRDKLGMLYALETDTQYTGDASYLHIHLNVPKSQLEPALSSIEECLQQLPLNIEQEHFILAQNAALLDIAQIQSQPPAYGYWLGEDLALTGTHLPFTAIEEQLQSLTKEDITALASKLLHHPFCTI
jgi:predicted Zn-dependent peptidase